MTFLIILTLWELPHLCSWHHPSFSKVVEVKLLVKVLTVFLVVSIMILWACSFEWFHHDRDLLTDGDWQAVCAKLWPSLSIKVSVSRVPFRGAYFTRKVHGVNHQRGGRLCYSYRNDYEGKIVFGGPDTNINIITRIVMGRLIYRGSSRHDIHSSLTGD